MTRRGAKLFAGIAWALSLVNSAAAQEISVEVTPTTATIGMPVTVTVRVTDVQDADVTFRPNPSFDDFRTTWTLVKNKKDDATGNLPEKPSQGRIKTEEYQVLPFALGDAILPAFEADVRTADGKTTTLVAPPSSVAVVPTLKPDEEFVEPTPYAVAKFPMPTWMWGTAAGLVSAALIAVGYFVTAGLRKKATDYLRGAKTADVRALQALEKLQNEGLLEARRVMEYYVRLSGIVRQYVQELERVPAFDLTTDELCDALEMTRFDAKDIRTLREVLNACDLVKFARYEPGAGDHRRAFDQAGILVRSTARFIYDLHAAAPAGATSGSEPPRSPEASRT